MYVVNAEQMRAADAHAINDLKIPSIELMENAATKVAGLVLGHYPTPRRLLVVCAKGNNGGDGMAFARIMKQHLWNPTLLLFASASDLKADPSRNW
jgi:NAD(P)H-hydrate repair Nnr-like enzyme with NAD(P)H-hydrate epimerase domain